MSRQRPFAMLHGLAAGYILLRLAGTPSAEALDGLVGTPGGQQGAPGAPRQVSDGASEMRKPLASGQEVHQPVAIHASSPAAGVQGPSPAAGAQAPSPAAGVQAPSPAAGVQSAPAAVRVRLASHPFPPPVQAAPTVNAESPQPAAGLEQSPAANVEPPESVTEPNDSLPLAALAPTSPALVESEESAAPQEPIQLAPMPPMTSPFLPLPPPPGVDSHKK